MNRERLSVILLVGLIGCGSDVIAAENAPSESLAKLLTQRGHHLFDVSDKDHDQGLNPQEQSDAEKRMQKVFLHLSVENKLAGRRIPPKVDEPKPLNPDSVTAEEFVQLFKSKAAQYDAQLRARRIAAGQIQSTSIVVMPVSAGRSNVVTYRYRDDDDRRRHHDFNRANVSLTSNGLNQVGHLAEFQHVFTIRLRNRNSRCRCTISTSKQATLVRAPSSR